MNDISYRGLVRPLSCVSKITRRTPTPGPHGRPLTPTPLPSSRTPSRVSSSNSTILISELTRERSQRVRERYQQLEEQAKPQRPVMVSSLSFSHDVLTQHAEVERTIRARSDSPAPVPSPIPLAESPPSLSDFQAPVPRLQQKPFALQNVPQQHDPTQQQDFSQQDLSAQKDPTLWQKVSDQDFAEQHNTSQHHGKPEEQQHVQQLDKCPGQEVLAWEPMSLSQTAP